MSAIKRVKAWIAEEHARHPRRGLVIYANEGGELTLDDLREVVALAERLERFRNIVYAVGHVDAVNWDDYDMKTLLPKAPKACPESSLVAWGTHLLAKKKVAPKRTRGKAR